MAVARKGKMPKKEKPKAKMKKAGRKPGSVGQIIGTALGLGAGAAALGVVDHVAKDDIHRKRRHKLNKKVISNIQKRRAADIKRLNKKGTKKSKARAKTIENNKFWTDDYEGYQNKSKGEWRPKDEYFEPKWRRYP